MKILIFFVVVFNVVSMTCQQVITKPGHYKIGENIVFNPTADNQVAVTIASSDVVLDLDNYMIIVQPGNTHLNTHGIFVNANMSNITIQNGQISQLTGSGIVIDQGCSRVFIEHMQTYSCDLVGISCAGTLSNPIKNVLLDHCLTLTCCQLATGQVVGGIQLVECQDSEVRNCQSNNNNNVNTSASMSGMFLGNCQRCTFMNNTAKNNQGVASCVGFALLDGQDNYFENCISIGNNVLSVGFNFSVGFVTFGTQTARTTFQSCVAAQNQGAGFAGGFLITDTNQDISFIDCVSLQNTATFQAFGFYVINNANTMNFINCIAKGNSADLTETTSAGGFILNNSQDCVLLNCLAAENHANTGVGFILNDCVNCEVQNCKAFNNIGLIDAFSYGFVININSGLPDSGNNQFFKNVASGNGLLVPNQFVNFPSGTFINTNYSLLDTIAAPFLNIGIVP